VVCPATAAVSARPLRAAGPGGCCRWAYGDGTITLYLDGVEVGRGKGGNSKGPITTTLRALSSERYLVLKGGFNPQVHFFNGAVAEFAFYNRELTADEVRRLAGKR
jgi:hypothetical protein